MSTDIFDELRAEIARARAKFPKKDHLFAALGEEVGELARELLEGGTPQRIREEAIQVACVALRIAEEGDGDFDDYRFRYSGGELAQIGDLVTTDESCKLPLTVTHIFEDGTARLMYGRGSSLAAIIELDIYSRPEASK